MVKAIKGESYYRTAEACHMAGISKATLFRWLREGTFSEARCRDRRGWRLFSQDEVDRLIAEVNRTDRQLNQRGDDGNFE